MTERETLTSFEELAEERRRTTDELMWQVPGLSVAAQAFLYTRAFDGSLSGAARVAIAVVALVTALATIQLLVKHRYHEETYSEVIDASRRARGARELKGARGFAALAREHGSPRYRRRWHNGVRGWRGWLAAPSSVDVWVVTLGVFAIVDCLVLIGTLP